MGGAGVAELERMLEKTATDLERTVVDCEALNASRPRREVWCAGTPTRAAVLCVIMVSKRGSGHHKP